MVGRASQSYFSGLGGGAGCQTAPTNLDATAGKRDERLWHSDEKKYGMAVGQQQRDLSARFRENSRQIAESVAAANAAATQPPRRGLFAGAHAPQKMFGQLNKELAATKRMLERSVPRVIATRSRANLPARRPAPRVRHLRPTRRVASSPRRARAPDDPHEPELDAAALPVGGAA
jgi:hypothetical protein